MMHLMPSYPKELGHIRNLIVKKNTVRDSFQYAKPNQKNQHAYV